MAPDQISLLQRHMIDSAVHHAMARFTDELGDLRNLVCDIASIAATTATENLKTYLATEVRLIQLDNERQLLMRGLRPPVLVTKDLPE